jgi:hypothetical protein
VETHESRLPTAPARIPASAGRKKSSLPKANSEICLKIMFFPDILKIVMSYFRENIKEFYFKADFLCSKSLRH